MAEISAEHRRRLSIAFETDDVAAVRAIVAEMTGGKGQAGRVFDPDIVLEAALLGAVKTLQFARESGAKFDKRWNGWTPLMHACVHNSVKGVAALLQAGADPNEGTATDDDGERRLTPLMFAAETNMEIVRLMLDAGADVKALTNRGRGAVNCALDTGRWDIARELLERGAPMREDGLVQAVNNNQLEMVEYLLAHGANPDAVGDKLGMQIRALESAIQGVGMAKTSVKAFSGTDRVADIDKSKQRAMEIVRRLVEACARKGTLEAVKAELRQSAKIWEVDEVLKLLGD